MNGASANLPFNAWLAWAGFAFDPFGAPEADTDAHLDAYFVQHPSFDLMKGDHSAFLFAPAGAGKTANRVMLARYCRTATVGQRLVPITYLPGPTREGRLDLTFGQHAEAVFQAGLGELLLHFARRPWEFDELPKEERATVRWLLDQKMAPTAEFLLRQVQERESLEPLVADADRFAELRGAPGPDMLRGFCKSFFETPAVRPSDRVESGHQRLAFLFAYFQRSINVGSFYVLVDGLDAYAETQGTPQGAMQLLHGLLQNLGWFESRKAYLKLFLPAELEELVRALPNNPLTGERISGKIQWTHQELRKLLRMRLLAASEGRLDSLDALSGPDVVGQLDEALVKVAKGWPRRLLSAGRWLIEWHLNNAGAEVPFSHAALEALQHWVRAHD